MKTKINFKVPLTDRDIVTICKQSQIPLRAVWMDDEIPDKCKDGNYIVNLESSFQSGSHWTCFILEKGTVYCFDPFGVYPDQPLVDNWNQNNYTIIMNDQDVQNINSILCGWFCIALFLFMKLNKGTVYQKYENYLKMFSKNTKLNDKILKDFITKYLS